MAKEKPQGKAPKGEKATAEKAATGAQEKGVSARLKERYRRDVIGLLMKRFSYTSPMQVPKLDKISINMGVGAATQDPKILDVAVKELEAITGQKAAITKSKKAISNFKLRENLPIGCRVTLRRDKMYEFLDRLISVALPRVRDFKGVPDKSFDGHGNYTLGIKEQIIFPEIDYDKIDKIKGLNITIVTSAKNDEEGKALLKLMGMPFRN